MPETAADPQYQEYLQAELQQAKEEIRAFRALVAGEEWSAYRTLCDRYIMANILGLREPVSTPEAVAAHNRRIGVISGLELACRLPEDLIKLHDELQDQLRVVRADTGGE